jgi:hypothetical protein
LQALKNAVRLVMLTDKFEEKLLSENFKTSIKTIISETEIELDVVDLVTAKQAKLLLDFFTNHRFILAGLIIDATESPLEKVLSDVNSGKLYTALTKTELKIAKKILLNPGRSIPIKQVTDCHNLLKDVLQCCTRLNLDGFGNLIEDDKKGRSTKKVEFKLKIV